MTTITTDAQLFSVTIRRTYTPEHRARWSDVPEHQDSSHPEWAESAEQIVDRWQAIHANQSEYWLAKFRDELLMVEPLNADEQRAKARRHEERCCDLAIVRPCVCSISFSCPEHGTKCVGTHD